MAQCFLENVKNCIYLRPLRELDQSERGGTANLRHPVMWLRSRTDPLKLIEIVQAVVVLAFAFAMPFLVVPTIAVLFIVLLERLGFTLLGKILVLLAVAAIIWLSLVALGYITV